MENNIDFRSSEERENEFFKKGMGLGFFIGVFFTVVTLLLLIHFFALPK